MAVLAADADGEVAQAGHGEGQAAGADLGAVLTEGPVANMVQLVLGPTDRDVDCPGQSTGGINHTGVHRPSASPADFARVSPSPNATEPTDVVNEGGISLANNCAMPCLLFQSERLLRATRVRCRCYGGAWT